MSTRRAAPRHRAASVRAVRPAAGGTVAGLALGAVLVTAGTVAGSHDASALVTPAASTTVPATTAVAAPPVAPPVAPPGTAGAMAGAPLPGPALPTPAPPSQQPAVEEQAASPTVVQQRAPEQPAVPPAATAVQRPPVSAAMSTPAPNPGARTLDAEDVRSLIDQLGALLGVELVIAERSVGSDPTHPPEPAHLSDPVDPADPATEPTLAQQAPPDPRSTPVGDSPSTPVDSAAATSTAGDEPFAGGRAFVAPDSDAAAAAASATDPAARAALERLAAEGSATWVGDWSGDPAAAVADVVAQASAADQTPTFALYNIPGRDCGSYSAGGAPDAEAYRSWIDGVSGGLAGSEAVVVLEPDALAGLECLPADAQGERLDLLADAAGRLDEAGATVYVDAGNPTWQPVDVMAERLEAVGVDGVRGFALNVSAYQSTEANEAYGGALVDALGGGAHYVIDTSRNGSGPASVGGEQGWCNPAGREVGEGFTTWTGEEEVDALLWVKVPGQSDGACGGGPQAGQWWPERAVELAGAAS